MPTYEYKCEKCGHHFDVFQRMTDEALKTCPAGLCTEDEWGQGRVRRLLSGGAGLIFKGSGFYITDYAKKSSSPATSETSSKSGEKSDNKAASEPTKKESTSKVETKTTGKQSDKS